ncbi:uncharacterized protein LOC131285593 [Anopheles ziemanni]|uniref:uncharacterized protein LOC131258533 n=1 Tax=Anopheles coustani TaxID=139045 RepID=UPI00265A0EFA|nr:uncharacterized protein LOC131258533 [Anopheles coustani]XP_058170435.1 uncharacterized protein LOC131285593 [Anopheles ziemanni]
MENPDGGAVVQMAKVKTDDLPEGLVLVSSGDEGGPQEEQEEDEQEEGEIQDDEDDVEPGNGQVGTGQSIQQLELEDISSEEESNIRERMAALEAMDKEVGLIHQISSRSAYDYLNSRDGMYGKENYFHYYEPRQQQRYSNTGHKSAKITAAKKQDNRREASKHERIAAHKRHLEKTKEKAKRCSHKKHKKRKHVSSSPSPERHMVSSDSEPEATVDREYLKIACATENVRKGDTAHASKNPLKRKLLLMTPRSREKSKKKVSVPAEKREKVVQMVIDSSSESEPDEDGREEEELQLRLLALRTKPIVKAAGLNELIPDLPEIPSPPPPPSLDTTPEDELPSEHMPFGPENNVTEEQKLRLIALKSAYLKKHETRLRRKEQDAERPYSPSDDLVLSPVRDGPPVYDELDNDLYSVGKASVEIVDDDNDVEIIEAPCELIALDDTEDEDGEEGGKDMEISSVDSPTVRDSAEQGNEDSQHPIDMELASSEQSSEPFPESLRSDIRPHSMLLMGADSCDSELFTRREKPPAQSPPMTPDSMEEAEAEALRHFLLTKMRQKQSQKPTVEEQVPMEETTTEEVTVGMVQPQKDESTLLDEPVGETFEQMPEELCSLSSPREEVSERMEEQESVIVECSTLPRTSAQVASQTVNSNLITLVNRTTSARKRRKKSQTIKSTGGMDSETVPSVFPSANKALAIATLPSATRPEPLKVSTVRTQKLVNNPNKLINLNQTISPSPPLLARNESPTIVDSFASKPVAKLVIQVGHSDSDSDVDFGSPTPNGEVETAASASGESPAGVPTAVRFEEQLDRFLKSVRSKASNTAFNSAENAKDGDHPESSSTEKGDVSTPKQQQAKGLANRAQVVANATVTSSAVKHLPKSAQMEYARLMARMAQLEQHKLARQQGRGPQERATTTNSEAATSPSKRRASFSEEGRTNKQMAKSPGRRKHLQSEAQAAVANPVSQDPIERKLQTIRASLPNLSEASRNRLLQTAEKQLEKHSGTLLQELEQHNATIYEAQHERRELFQIDSRIELLKEKLAILERAHEQQRQRSVDSFASLQESHRKVLASRKRAAELERMCFEIGQRIVGEEYQLPASPNGPVLQEQLRILATETRQLRAIRKPTLEEFKEQLLAKHRRKAIESSNAVPDKDDSQDQAQDHPEEGAHDDAEEEEEPALPQLQESEGTVVGVSLEREDPEEGEIVENDTSNGVFETDKLGEIQEEPAPESEPHPDNSEEQIEPIVPSMACDVQSAEDSVNDKSSAQESVEPNHVADQEQIVAIVVDEDTNNDAQSLKQATEEAVLEEVVEQTEATQPMDHTHEPIAFVKYTSPLLSLKQGVQHIPTGVLCPYELGGQCVDRECKFEHFNQQ